MKKFAIVLLFTIAILFVILLLKMNIITFSNKEENSTTYSNEDIQALILKGQENLVEMQNVYFELHSGDTICKYYYKGTKAKIDYYLDSFYSFSRVAVSLISNKDENKMYLINHRTKTIEVMKNLNSGYGFQQGLLNQLQRNDSYTFTFTYIKDEEIDGKDCIFIKENRLDKNTYLVKYPDSYTSVYWLEKSTGFKIGEGSMIQTENAAIPTVLTKNITFGTVEDNEFEIPKGYKVE